MVIRIPKQQELEDPQIFTILSDQKNIMSIPCDESFLNCYHQLCFMWKQKVIQ